MAQMEPILNKLFPVVPCGWVEVFVGAPVPLSSNDTQEFQRMGPDYKNPTIIDRISLRSSNPQALPSLSIVLPVQDAANVILIGQPRAEFDSFLTWTLDADGSYEPDSVWKLCVCVDSTEGISSASAKATTARREVVLALHREIFEAWSARDETRVGPPKGASPRENRYDLVVQSARKTLGFHIFAALAVRCRLDDSRQATIAELNLFKWPHSNTSPQPLLKTPHIPAKGTPQANMRTWLKFWTYDHQSARSGIRCTPALTRPAGTATDAFWAPKVPIHVSARLQYKLGHLSPVVPCMVAETESRPVEQSLWVCVQGDETIADAIIADSVAAELFVRAHVGFFNFYTSTAARNRMSDNFTAIKNFVDKLTFINSLRAAKVEAWILADTDHHGDSLYFSDTVPSADDSKWLNENVPTTPVDATIDAAKWKRTIEARAPSPAARADHLSLAPTISLLLQKRDELRQALATMRISVASVPTEIQTKINQLHAHVSDIAETFLLSSCSLTVRAEGAWRGDLVPATTTQTREARDVVVSAARLTKRAVESIGKIGTSARLSLVTEDSPLREVSRVLQSFSAVANVISSIGVTFVDMHRRGIYHRRLTAPEQSQIDDTRILPVWRVGNAKAAEAIRLNLTRFLESKHGKGNPSDLEIGLDSWAPLWSIVHFLAAAENAFNGDAYNARDMETLTSIQPTIMKLARRAKGQLEKLQKKLQPNQEELTLLRSLEQLATFVQSLQHEYEIASLVAPPGFASVISVHGTPVKLFTAEKLATMIAITPRIPGLTENGATPWLETHLLCVDTLMAVMRFGEERLMRYSRQLFLRAVVLAKFTRKLPMGQTRHPILEAGQKVVSLKKVTEAHDNSKFEDLEDNLFAPLGLELTVLPAAYQQQLLTPTESQEKKQRAQQAMVYSNATIPLDKLSFAHSWNVWSLRQVAPIKRFTSQLAATRRLVNNTMCTQAAKDATGRHGNASNQNAPRDLLLAVSFGSYSSPAIRTFTDRKDAALRIHNWTMAFDRMAIVATWELVGKFSKSIFAWNAEKAAFEALMAKTARERDPTIKGFKEGTKSSTTYSIKRVSPLSTNAQETEDHPEHHLDVRSKHDARWVVDVLMAEIKKAITLYQEDEAKPLEEPLAWNAFVMSVAVRNATMKELVKLANPAVFRGVLIDNLVQKTFQTVVDNFRNLSLTAHASSRYSRERVDVFDILGADFHVFPPIFNEPYDWWTSEKKDIQEENSPTANRFKALLRTHFEEFVPETVFQYVEMDARPTYAPIATAVAASRPRVSEPMQFIDEAPVDWWQTAVADGLIHPQRDLAVDSVEAVVAVQTTLDAMLNDPTKRKKPSRSGAARASTFSLLWETYLMRRDVMLHNDKIIQHAFECVARLNAAFAKHMSTQNEASAASGFEARLNNAALAVKMFRIIEKEASVDTSYFNVIYKRRKARYLEFELERVFSDRRLHGISSKRTQIGELQVITSALRIIDGILKLGAAYREHITTDSHKTIELAIAALDVLETFVDPYVTTSLALLHDGYRALFPDHASESVLEGGKPAPNASGKPSTLKDLPDQKEFRLKLDSLSIDPKKEKEASIRTQALDWAVNNLRNLALRNFRPAIDSLYSFDPLAKSLYFFANKDPGEIAALEDTTIIPASVRGALSDSIDQSRAMFYRATEPQRAAWREVDLAQITLAYETQLTLDRIVPSIRKLITEFTTTYLYTPDLRAAPRDLTTWARMHFISAFFSTFQGVYITPSHLESDATTRDRATEWLLLLMVSAPSKQLARSYAGPTIDEALTALGGCRSLENKHVTRNSEDYRNIKTLDSTILADRTALSTLHGEKKTFSINGVPDVPIPATLNAPRLPPYAFDSVVRNRVWGNNGDDDDDKEAKREHSVVERILPLDDTQIAPCVPFRGVAVYAPMWQRIKNGFHLSEEEDRSSCHQFGELQLPLDVEQSVALWGHVTRASHPFSANAYTVAVTDWLHACRASNDASQEPQGPNTVRVAVDVRSTDIGRQTWSALMKEFATTHAMSYFHLHDSDEAFDQWRRQQQGEDESKKVIKWTKRERDLIRSDFHMLASRNHVVLSDWRMTWSIADKLAAPKSERSLSWPRGYDGVHRGELFMFPEPDRPDYTLERPLTYAARAEAVAADRNPSAAAEPPPPVDSFGCHLFPLVPSLPATLFLASLRPDVQAIPQQTRKKIKIRKLYLQTEEGLLLREKHKKTFGQEVFAHNSNVHSAPGAVVPVPQLGGWSQVVKGGGKPSAPPNDGASAQGGGGGGGEPMHTKETIHSCVLTNATSGDEGGASGGGGGGGGGGDSASTAAGQQKQANLAKVEEAIFSWLDYFHTAVHTAGFPDGVALAEEGSEAFMRPDGALLKPLLALHASFPKIHKTTHTALIIQEALTTPLPVDDAKREERRQEIISELKTPLFMTVSPHDSQAAPPQQATAIDAPAIVTLRDVRAAMRQHIAIPALATRPSQILYRSVPEDHPAENKSIFLGGALDHAMKNQNLGTVPYDIRATTRVLTKWGLRDEAGQKPLPWNEPLEPMLAYTLSQLPTVVFGQLLGHLRHIGDLASYVDPDTHYTPAFSHIGPHATTGYIDDNLFGTVHTVDRPAVVYASGNTYKFEFDMVKSEDTMAARPFMHLAALAKRIQKSEAVSSEEGKQYVETEVANALYDLLTTSSTSHALHEVIRQGIRMNATDIRTNLRWLELALWDTVVIAAPTFYARNAFGIDLLKPPKPPKKEGRGNSTDMWLSSLIENANAVATMEALTRDMIAARDEFQSSLAFLVVTSIITLPFAKDPQDKEGAAGNTGAPSELENGTYASVIANGITAFLQSFSIPSELIEQKKIILENCVRLADVKSAKVARVASALAAYLRAEIAFVSELCLPWWAAAEKNEAVDVFEETPRVLWPPKESPAFQNGAFITKRDPRRAQLVAANFGSGEAHTLRDVLQPIVDQAYSDPDASSSVENMLEALGDTIRKNQEDKRNRLEAEFPFAQNPNSTPYPTPKWHAWNSAETIVEWLLSDASRRVLLDRRAVQVLRKIVLSEPRFQIYRAKAIYHKHGVVMTTSVSVHPLVWSDAVPSALIDFFAYPPPSSHAMHPIRCAQKVFPEEFAT